MTVVTGRQFRLPDVGEGLTEAEIVTWRVAPGDRVAVNDPLVEIETAKSLVELPSPYAGVVAELLVPAGQLVPVGTPIIAITDDGEMAKPGIGKPDEEKPPSTLVGYGPGHSRGRARRRPPATQPATPEPPAEKPASAQSPNPSGSGRYPQSANNSNGTGRPLAKPPVRKLAKDLGVDLASLRGSGPHGDVTRDDVRQAATAVPERPQTVAAVSDDEHIPVRGVRAATAAAMTASAFTAPHVTVFHTVDVTRSVKLVEKLRADKAFDGSRVTIMLLAARALCLAAREFPDLNATFDQDANEIVLHHRVNLGVATASERGLLVPSVEGAGSLSLPALAREVTRTTELARSGKASPAQLSGSTITLTNIGVFGVDSGTPILNPGQSAILCLGSVRRAPAEHQGRIALRWMTQLAMSFDHRIIDGQQGARALARIGAILADPRRELLLA
ncbi:2-oxo acid dehydrogenase subunit E2 [Kineosporia rhizophila]|uniref:dihydrolipoamide acetyltransferase family protein n=1 Tax=Kineosporia TaxID=49184 RepID=UPI001E62FBC5|nr:MULTISPECIES: dihydrolipoamide acetyltransferase family protein [Kineosporia]MCE0539678.1 2-oxo acid dehydrogenase subunit E2 [Kineosporia rhizophila]GLY16428.1 dihydrolipoamide acetyltransferase component of pyruvate dehydrogenase complex [Kineosporia sp. NBRC 101677]